MTSHDITVESLLLWAEMDEHKKKISEANNIISRALKSAQKPYLSYSGGKDSLVTLALVVKIYPEILVYHHHEGEHMPDEVFVEIIDNAKAVGAKNIEIRPRSESLWDDIIPDLHKRGYDLCFVGLRKEEATRRKKRIEKNRSMSAIKECWPLQNWRWQDVWAYILSNKIRYPKIYDKYNAVLGWGKARFHSFFDPRMDKFGNSNVDGILMWKYKNKLKYL